MITSTSMYSLKVYFKTDVFKDVLPNYARLEKFTVLIITITIRLNLIVWSLRKDGPTFLQDNIDIFITFHSITKLRLRMTSANSMKKKEINFSLDVEAPILVCLNLTNNKNL